MCSCLHHVLVAQANHLCKLHRFTVTYFDKDGIREVIFGGVLKFGDIGMERQMCRCNKIIYIFNSMF